MTYTVYLFFLGAQLFRKSNTLVKCYERQATIWVPLLYLVKMEEERMELDVSEWNLTMHWIFANHAQESELLRPNSLFLRGVDNLAEKDIKSYVKRYVSDHFKFEWINDSSCMYLTWSLFVF